MASLFDPEEQAGPGLVAPPSAPVQESARQAGQVQNWRAAGLYVAGGSRSSSGKVCQDRIRIDTRGDVLACTLADGAGSRCKSDTGAQVAVTEVCAELVEHFEELLLASLEELAARLIGRVTDALAAEAQRLDCALREFASTLAFVAVCDRRFIAGNLGDGVVARVGSSSEEILIPPERGEFANQTYFATDPGAAGHLRIKSGTLDQYHGFILMTDGPAKLLYDYRTRRLAPNGVQIGGWLLGHEADPVLDGLDEILARDIVPRAGDDCTIGLVTCIDPGHAVKEPVASEPTPAPRRKKARRARRGKRKAT